MQGFAFHKAPPTDPELAYLHGPLYVRMGLTAVKPHKINTSLDVRFRSLREIEV